MTLAMDVSLTRLPRLLMVLVLAFAPFEPRPTLAAVELFRGMALQLSYRWATGGVVAEDSDRAVLFWTDCAPTTRRDCPREALGVLVSVATGLVLFVACNALLLIVVKQALVAAGAGAGTIRDTCFAIIALRLAVTAWRAVGAYRHDAGLMARLAPPAGARWRIDLLAASPGRSGHGRELLWCFLERADRGDVEVVLNCDSRNASFYGHHGFVLAADRAPGSQLLMVRPALTVRRERARQAQRGRLQGHLRRSAPGSGRRQGT